MTRKRLERSTEVDYRALWSLESGRTKNPHISTLVEIAKAFEMPLSELIAFLANEPGAGCQYRRELLDVLPGLSEPQRAAIVERARVLSEIER